MESVFYGNGLEGQHWDHQEHAGCVTEPSMSIQFVLIVEGHVIICVENAGKRLRLIQERLKHLQSALIVLDGVPYEMKLS